MKKIYKIREEQRKLFLRRLLVDRRLKIEERKKIYKEMGWDGFRVKLLTCFEKWGCSYITSRYKNYCDN